MQYTFVDNRPQLSDPFFVLPSGFDPIDYLDGPLRKRCEDAKYLVSTIIWRTSIGALDERGRVLLKTEYLDRVMAKDDRAAVVEALIRGGVIHRDQYLVGKKSYGYWLDNRFRGQRYGRHEVTDKRLDKSIRRLIRERSMEQELRMLPIHRYLKEMQVALTIEQNEAFEDLPSIKNERDSQRILVDWLIDRSYFFSVGKYGRVSNSISNLSRKLRRSLRIAGQKIGHVDIKNSQPAFLGKLLNQQDQGESKGDGDRTEKPYYESENSRANKDDQNQKSVRRYCELVQSGRFYDAMLMDFPGMERDEYKRQFLCNVLAKRRVLEKGTKLPTEKEYPNEVEDHFRSEFPPVYRYIRNVNQNGLEHANLIRELQRQESDLVIGKVSERLRDRHPDISFITLHDSIYAPASRLDEIHQAFEDTFKQTGFRMATKLEAA